MAAHRVGFDRSHQQGDWDYLFDSFTDPARGYEPIDNLGDRTALDALDVLVVAPPRKSLISAADATAVQRWVRSGRGVLILGYYAADTHHESNPSAIARLFGFEFGDDLLMPAGASGDDSRRHVFTLDRRLAVTVRTEAPPHPALAGVTELALLSSCSIASANAPASAVLVETPPDSLVMLPEGPKTADGFRRTIYTWNHQRTGSSPVIALSEHGAGRVAICGTWKIFTLASADNAAFVDGLIGWLAQASAATGRRPPTEASVMPPAAAAPPTNTAIRVALVDHFNLDELRTLSADLNVDLEDIAGDTREAKSRELVEYFARRDRLPDLVAKIRAERGAVV